MASIISHILHFGHLHLAGLQRGANTCCMALDVARYRRAMLGTGQRTQEGVPRFLQGGNLRRHTQGRYGLTFVTHAGKRNIDRRGARVAIRRSHRKTSTVTESLQS